VTLFEVQVGRPWERTLDLTVGVFCVFLDVAFCDKKTFFNRDRAHRSPFLGVLQKRFFGRQLHAHRSPFLRLF